MHFWLQLVAETRKILAIIPRLIGGFAVSVILGLDVAINADVRSPRMLILRLCAWEPLNLLQTKKLVRRLLHRSQWNHELYISTSTEFNSFYFSLYLLLFIALKKLTRLKTTCTCTRPIYRLVETYSAWEKSRTAQNDHDGVKLRFP